ncbi:hypothetical protein NQZ68_012530 [Dissostichus eleginoides]|nr:hypothetical protein NQZ68_012530 [Dissostichus eleginoides]
MSCCKVTEKNDEGVGGVTSVPCLVSCTGQCISHDAFEVLAESYEFNNMEGPCLAFRRATSVLKSLPWAVRCLGATQDLPCLGQHTKKVIELLTSLTAFSDPDRFDRSAHQDRYGPPPEFPLDSPCPGIIHHLSGPIAQAHAPPPRLCGRDGAPLGPGSHLSRRAPALTFIAPRGFECTL